MTGEETGRLDDSNRETARQRCYTCFRPVAVCHCSAIPRIANQTPVLLLQHRRESFHPFNTARIVRRGLVNSQLIVDHNERLAAQVNLLPGAALLFPGPRSTLLDEAAARNPPRQLVVIDGTWHQAKTLLRHVPALRELPQYHLAPAQPSNFRIRQEPNEQALSTIEAVVAALRILEPSTHGFDELLSVFDLMVDRQLAHPKPDAGRRRNRRGRRVWPYIPEPLLHELNRVVVTYCECEGAPRGTRRGPQRAMYLAAERLGSGDCFESPIRTDPPVSETLLGHFELDRERFSSAPDFEQVRAKWAEFLRPNDLIVVYGFGTLRLLRELCPPATKFLVLKSINFHPTQRFESLDHMVTELSLAVPPVRHAGRAGRRVANAKALVAHLQAIGVAALSGEKVRPD